MKAVYDVLVVGGGPGGYTAACYAARAGLKTLVLEKLSAGGQMATAAWIENFPGFDEGIDGFTLGQKMKNGAEHFGAKTVYATVQELFLQEMPKRIVTSEGIFFAWAVVLAMGASPKKLGIPGEKELLGRGVSYCATCDAMFFRGKTVAVVGGGDTAVADALVLARVCKKVYLLHRRSTLRASGLAVERLHNAENIELIWNAQLLRLDGENKLETLLWRDGQTGAEQQLVCDGLFVAIGRRPETELVKGQLKVDENGYIPASETTRTEIPGVYAVGDLRAKPLRQIVTACADGAVAASLAEQELASLQRKGKELSHG